MSALAGATATSWNERLVSNPYIKTVPKLKVSVDVLALLYWRRLVSCDLTNFTRHDLWVEWQPIRGRKLDLLESDFTAMSIQGGTNACWIAQAVLTVSTSVLDFSRILGYPHTNVDLVNIVDTYSNTRTITKRVEKVLKLSEDIAHAEHTKYTRRTY